MFIKLVVLILVCGSSGVGLLSVRQSRLQAAHEMAEARHRIQRLDEQTGEIRMQIARSCTPERVSALVESRGISKPGYDPAVHHPVRMVSGDQGTGSESTIEYDGSEPVWMDEAFESEHSWILDDRSRDIFVGE